MKETILLVLLITPALAFSGEHLHPEKWYQSQWCNEQGGVAEVVLTDGTRADCVTQTHAIEFDFDKKWAESLGQALHYSQQTGKRAGIVLIMEPGGERHLNVLKTTIEHFNLPVDVWELR